jgi:hypothetical protein
MTTIEAPFIPVPNPLYTISIVFHGCWKGRTHIAIHPGVAIPVLERTSGRNSVSYSQYILRIILTFHIGAVHHAHDTHVLQKCISRMNNSDMISGLTSLQDMAPVILDIPVVIPSIPVMLDIPPIVSIPSMPDTSPIPSIPSIPSMLPIPDISCLRTKR